MEDKNNKEDKNKYIVLADDIQKVVSSLISLGDSSSILSNIALGISDIIGLGSGLSGTIELIKKGFAGSDGVTALVGFGISTLINVATVLSEKAQEIYEKNYEKNVENFNEGADSLPRENRGFAFSTDTMNVMEMVEAAKEGHAPMAESDFEQGASTSAYVKSGSADTSNMENFEKNVGLASEYQYQLYLEELDNIILAAQEREEAAWDAFDAAIANGESSEDAARAYDEAMKASSEQLSQEVNNAQKAYNAEMMELNQATLKALRFEMTAEMKFALSGLKRAYGENNHLAKNAALNLLSMIKGTDAERFFQGQNDKGYFEAMGITDENKNLYGNWLGFGGRSDSELAAMILSFFGGVDPNASQYGDVEGAYRYNSVAETAETPQAGEAPQTGAINYQEITSPEDFANLYGGISEDSEAYAGLNSSVAAILPQVFSSEEFGASLTTALTTAFASEDLWATLGETINGGFTTMVEGQLETFTEYGADLGKAMTAGLAQGIDSGTARVCSSIRSMATRAVAEARKRLDINSPSRVFRQIGLSTGEGFALGIDESLLLAENAAMRMAEGVARAGAGTNAGAGRGAVVNLNVNQPSIRSDDDVRRLSEEFARYTAAMTYGL